MDEMAGSRRGPLVPLALLAGLLLVVSACGDSGASTTEPTRGTISPSTTAAPGRTATTGREPAAGVTSTGRVTDPEGAPVPGALLDLEALDGQPNAAIESLRRTDDQGRYQLALAPGRWVLTVSAAGFALQEVDLDVPTTGTLEHDIVLARP